MKNKSKLLSVSIMTASALLFSGCLDNPFGVGYEHSACESSSGAGVCGSPKDIYQNRDKIRIVQQDYIKSGLEQELFFGISKEGEIIVKDERGSQWQNYEQSKYKKEIEEILNKKDALSKNSEKNKYANVNYSISDIPVTEGNDLSVSYKKQGSLIQTRTNVGNMIRDYGLIQKVWIAPVVDKKGDLISAHDILVVVKDPKWIIGEETPKNVNSDKIGQIPTPISKSLLEMQSKTSENDGMIVNTFNTGNDGGLIEAISKDPEVTESEFRKNMNQIENFIKE